MTSTTGDQLYKLEMLLLGVLRNVTGLESEKLDSSTAFASLGLESLSVTKFNTEISEYIKNLPKTILYDTKDIRDLAKLSQTYLPFIKEPDISQQPSTPRVSWEGTVREHKTEVIPAPDDRDDNLIAVIGLDCQFPGASNAEQYWDLLRAGRCAITEIPSNRWSLDGFFSQFLDSRKTWASYSKWGAFLDGIDHFDTNFFGIAPREAAATDPQERMMLQCAYRALDDAALNGERLEAVRRLDGTLCVGVYVGATTNTYPILGPEAWRSGGIEIPTGMPWSIANRISYSFDFCGPSLAIDTACSSSLVALSIAAQHLRDHVSDVAIVGGVNLYTHPVKYVQLCRSKMLSPSGKSSPFGVDADGFVPGEGVAALVLRRFADAVRENDRILGVISATAVNHGGLSNGYTVPTPSAQASVITSALTAARRGPNDISYVEAHGTGTALGDPIELAGLHKAFTSRTVERPCMLGSVKGNLGHLEAAAGLAGLVKLILQLQHDTIAPSINSDTINPLLEIEQSGFEIPHHPLPWPKSNSPRVAGVSSFGAGGTNAHVLIEDPPQNITTCEANNLYPNKVFMFPMSAKSHIALKRNVENLCDFVISRSEASHEEFVRLAYTLQCGRRSFATRVLFLASSWRDLSTSINQYLERVENTAAWRESDGSSRGGQREGGVGQPPLNYAIEDAWLSGNEVQWSKNWTHPPTPVSGPRYQFSQERHWIARSESDRHTKTFSATTPTTVSPECCSEHIIQGEPILPGVAYIEAIRASLVRGHEPRVMILKDVVWRQPLRDPRTSVELEIDQSTTHVAGAPDIGQRLTVSSGPKEDRVEHLVAILLSNVAHSDAQYSEYPLKSGSENKCRAASIQSLYAKFESSGIHYGPDFRTIRSAKIFEDGSVVTRIRATKKPIVGLNAGYLGLMDGILQTAALIIARDENIHTNESLVPYRAELIEILGELSGELTVFASRRASEFDGNVIEYNVYDSNEAPVARLSGVIFRRYKDNNRPITIFEELWKTDPDAIRPDILVSHEGTTLSDRITSTCDELPLVIRHGAMFEYISPRFVTLDFGNSDHRNHLEDIVRTDGAEISWLLVDLGGQDIADRGAYATLAETDNFADLVRNIAKTIPLSRLHISVGASEPVAASLVGLLRSVIQEAPGLSGTVIATNGEHTIDDLRGFANDECRALGRTGLHYVRYVTGYREIRIRRRCLLPAELELPFVSSFQKGVVVVTGGHGAVGRTLASELASRTGASIAILGRSSETHEINKHLADLKRVGAKDAGYWQVDCSDATDMESVVSDLRSKYGNIKGIVHCAGVLADGYLTRQGFDSLSNTWKPKAITAELLDELTSADPLEFFIICSSLAGVIGNAGQSAYSSANSWLNWFAETRNERVVAGERTGHTMAIAWPLWETVSGMTASEGVKRALTDAGIRLLSSNEAASIFVGSLQGLPSVIVPIPGNESATAKLLNGPTAKHTPQYLHQPKYNESFQDGSVRDFIFGALNKVTGAICEPDSIDVPIEDYGLDSILIEEFHEALTKRYEFLPKTTLFEIRSIRDLLAYIEKQTSSHDAEDKLIKQRDVDRRDTLNSCIARPMRISQTIAAGGRSNASSGVHNPQITASAGQPINKAYERRAIGPASIAVPVREQQNTTHEKKNESRMTTAVRGAPLPDDQSIAIVGLAGSYPGSRSSDELWKHIADGADLVTEANGRWKPHPSIYSNWGGFIEDFDKFDPLFFGISPRDAERMDPQERLFLQCAWHAIEDAGYTPASLSGERSGLAKTRRVGVVAACMYGEYQFYGATGEPDSEHVLANSSYSAIANRVSYCLDLDGPSFTVDSMCSSSLTAIHLASDMLRAKTCDAVISGGVNLSEHFYKYLTLCKLGFAARDGKCRSYGKGGTGYVPGEGVGVVVLKRLCDAVDAGDYIHAIIAGSSLGHGGRTSAFTVPSPIAQADVIKRAHSAANIPPSAVTYVEGHGTGTALGDPIEIRGLQLGLGYETTAPETEIPLGSIKANIGHLEAAAGIAGLTKIILQLRQNAIAPSIHSHELNPDLRLEETPFFVPQTLTSWPRLTTPDGKYQARTACLSAFGAGGSNAHFVIREWIDDLPAQDDDNSEFIVPLSAKSKSQLLAMLSNLARVTDALMKSSERYYEYYPNARKRYSVRNIASTLTWGRIHHKERAAIVCGSLTELRAGIEVLLDPDAERLVLGQRSDPILTGAASDWVKGGSVSWRIKRWHRVPLPGYEFEQRRYWPEDLPKASLRKDSESRVLSPPEILELVDQKVMSREEAERLLKELMN